MSGNDPIFGIHAQALKVHQQRLEILSSNIANADTPGFQARDIDFKSTLEQAMNSAAPGPAKQTGQQGVLQADPILQYRVPMQPSADGNTVDVQVEQAAFMDSAMRYQATLGFLDGKLKGLLSAITGE